ncbi:hypothetical protein BRN33_17860 [Xanthomonas oryzae pv. oryzae]|nr:hypothetical protein BRL93_12180 [Xanthomonas oryzae pv. oryzae]RBJ42282.1 hypothetical protein BRN91_06725 [Xanthomonas oryzae pv. oryzae]RBL08685.1 hypothetical protein BRN33_17860 [Xanthomonas oryzae pv. oryzae]
MLQNRADLLEPLTAHVTWIVLLAHSWSLHGLNKIVNRFLRAGTCICTKANRTSASKPFLRSAAATSAIRQTHHAKMHLITIPIIDQCATRFLSPRSLCIPCLLSLNRPPHPP